MVNHPNRQKRHARANKRAAVAIAQTVRAPRRPAAPRHDHDRDYSALLGGVKAAFASVTAGSVGPLFRTDAAGLYEMYLDRLPARERQVHNCHSCRRFIEAYGGLVHVTAEGKTWPVMWDPIFVPEFYKPAFTALQNKVLGARITDVFLTTEKTWGQPLTGAWTHIAVEPPAHLLYRGSALTAGQAIAGMRENVKTVQQAIVEFSPDILDQAIRLLEGEHLARPEKFVEPVRWLRRLHDRPKGKAGGNLLWRAVATAPEGFCHPRASVIGSLLEDIAAGKTFENIKRSFAAKVGPTVYQRPQAPPSAGNIKQAEALFEKLDLAPALDRRFATFEDMREFAWLPSKPAAPAGSGVFGHLQPKGSAPVTIDTPAQTMTWEKFRRVVMNDALKIDLLVPPHGGFIALTTAANPDAPPILMWDTPENRNTVAWYVYPNGSPSKQWGLTVSTWHPVTGVVPFPNLWGDRPMPHMGDGHILLLDGARDTRIGESNALFPEQMRSDLHGVRATIEAFSKSAKLAGREEASACGYDIRKSLKMWPIYLRVTTAAGSSTYVIDRWD